MFCAQKAAGGDVRQRLAKTVNLATAMCLLAAVYAEIVAGLSVFRLPTVAISLAAFVLAHIISQAVATKLEQGKPDRKSRARAGMWRNV